MIARGANHAWLQVIEGHVIRKTANVQFSNVMTGRIAVFRPWLRMAVEYSDRADYFAGDMKKAEADLTKALGNKPKANEIFLLPGTQRRPQKADAFLEVVMAWPQMLGRTLHLWGSEEVESERRAGRI